MIEPNETFNFALTYPSSTDSRDLGVARLQVADNETGLLVMRVDFTPEQLIRLLRSTYTTVPCWFHPANTRHRIGMQVVRKTLPVPREYAPTHVRREVDSGWSWDNTLAQAWASGVCGKPVDQVSLPTTEADKAYVRGRDEWYKDTQFFDESHLSHTNSGWVCHFTRYTKKVVDTSIEPHEAREDRGTRT